jgi:hypothetical protein
MFHLDIWQGTHLYHFFKLLDYINKQKPRFLTALALSFSTYSFAFICDITIVKDNITKVRHCGFGINQRSKGETITLSLHLSDNALIYV